MLPFMDESPMFGHGRAGGAVGLMTGEGEFLVIPGWLTQVLPYISQPYTMTDEGEKRPDDPASAEAKRLEGHWRGVALESDGRRATATELEAMKGGGWVFKGSEVSFEDPNAPGKSAYKLDPSKSPKEIDLIGTEGPQKGKTMEGIYKLEDGRLTICVRDLAAAEKGRPTAFTTEAGSGLGLIVLERADR
jgi:uncharacterized protein (TIGR03067 family)